MTVALETAERSEADVVCALLAAASIPSVLQSDDAGRTHPELLMARPIRVLVRSEDAEDARLILEDARSAGDESDDES